jgi:NADP-dependent 3-hydroxy acid dehydrogenase YdfG
MGASSGIGRTTARLLAERGARVVLGAVRAEILAGVVDEIAAAGGEARYRVTDLTCRADLETLVASAVEGHSRLDVIVNNAGIAPRRGLRRDDRR